MVGEEREQAREKRRKERAGFRPHSERNGTGQESRSRRRSEGNAVEWSDAGEKGRAEMGQCSLARSLLDLRVVGRCTSVVVARGYLSAASSCLLVARAQNDEDVEDERALRVPGSELANERPRKPPRSDRRCKSCAGARTTKVPAGHAQCGQSVGWRFCLRRQRTPAERAHRGVISGFASANPNRWLVVHALPPSHQLASIFVSEKITPSIDNFGDECSIACVRASCTMRASWRCTQAAAIERALVHAAHPYQFARIL